MTFLRIITRDQYNPIEAFTIMVIGGFVGSHQYLTAGAILTLGFVASFACRAIVKLNSDQHTGSIG